MDVFYSGLSKIPRQILYFFEFSCDVTPYPTLLKNSIIRHFRVALNLIIKARLSALVFIQSFALSLAFIMRFTATSAMDVNVFITFDFVGGLRPILTW